ncbi:MFS general substrate transporter [Macrolepiota fuliginosa MF-IS2]|uniref:MFS general substrate transporter n=1 Tax=Macrolepiota fuliginosa MF-IS2 TaxID=1400762 RepID=A0A9P5X1J1_9AGAR|nr:MFS general substrate transporter [Macrolepiota fuliginosa MF-IS2]
MSSIRSIDKNVLESPTSIPEFLLSDLSQDDLDIINDMVKLPRDQPLKKSGLVGDTPNEKGTQQPDDKKAKQDDEFPDGGLRAWLIVVGGACITFSTSGYIASWGIFQAYYQETLLKGVSPSSIAWIGSIQYALVFLPGLIVGRLFDLGHFYLVFLPSSIAIVVATFLIGQCTQYWHFLLCQGFATGLAVGGIFGCGNPVISHWFKKKRASALGYMAVGSSLGGTVIPIIIKNLLSRVGFPWTMRILGFIHLVMCGIANLTIKPRLPPMKVKGGLLNLAAFKDPPFTVYCISSFITFLGIYTALIYVNVSASQFGISPNLAFYFVSIANASAAFGRGVTGICADKFGPLNILIPFTFFAGILTYAWPFARSAGPLLVVIVLYGFSSGAFISLLLTTIMNFGGEGDAGRRVGMFLTTSALGALAGPPISGAINATTGGFEAVGYFAGSAIILGVLGLIIVRYLKLGRWIGKV